MEKPKSILITGAAGFAGTHHVERMLNNTGAHIIATGRHMDRLDQMAAEHPQRRRLTRVTFDLATDPDRVTTTIREYQPDAIIHLAAFPGRRGTHQETLNNNNISTQNLLDAVRDQSRDSLVVVTTSSALYGNLAGELQEDMPLPPPDPDNPYAVSKYNDLSAIEVYRAAGVRIVEARVFNHTGPGQRGGLYSGLIREAVEAERASRPLEVAISSGDYTRDVQHGGNWAAADERLMQQETGTFNVCGGEPITLVQFLDAVRERTGATIDTEEDISQLRGAPLQLWGNNQRLRDTGWQQEYPFTQMIDETATFWEQELSQS